MFLRQSETAPNNRLKRVKLLVTDCVFKRVKLLVTDCVIQLAFTDNTTISEAVTTLADGVLHTAVGTMAEWGMMPSKQ